MGIFLSTLPVRGATDPKMTPRQVEKISIHAPREGSDQIAAVKPVAAWVFLSTLPVRGATVRPSAVSPGAKRFLSTLPVRGATAAVLAGQYLGPISIHAPREGSDCGPGPGRSWRSYFYPRSP